MSADEAYLCPTCDTAVDRNTARCPVCSADLSVMIQLRELPDALFNDALSAARRKRWLEAATALSAALQWRPRDAEAWRLLGKVYGLMGADEAAQACLGIAAMQQKPPSFLTPPGQDPPEET